MRFYVPYCARNSKVYSKVDSCRVTFREVTIPEGASMSCRALLLILLSAALSGPIARAQTVPTDVCPFSKKLICVVPEVFGVNGLQQGIGALRKIDSHMGGHFEQSFLSNLTPLNVAVGSELTLLPLGSPGAGLIYTYDAALKTFKVSTEDFGPVLTERANTVGTHKLRIGFSYQHFSFSTLDGASVKSLPIVFTHIGDVSDFTGNGVPAANCNANPAPGQSNTGACGFVRDFISTTNDIALRLNQFTAYATFGLTRRIDVSLAVPIIDVRMDVTSDATIVDNSHSGDHQFSSTDPTCPLPPGSALPPTSPCAHKIFTNSNSATGIGDIVLRAKGTLWEGERAAVALGADVRFASGDELNFLGSGTTGFRPFAIFSYAARVAPHVNVGYEVNGESTLAGTITPPQPVGLPQNITTPSSLTKGHLPNQFIYSGGVDVVLVPRRLAGAFDVISQRVLRAQRAIVVNQTFPGACGPAGLSPSDPNYCTTPGPNITQPTLSATKSSFNITNASLGLKVRASDKFLIFGNALIKLDKGGLRAKVVPLVGASYSF